MARAAEGEFCRRRAIPARVMRLQILAPVLLLLLAAPVFGPNEIFRNGRIVTASLGSLPGALGAPRQNPLSRRCSLPNANALWNTEHLQCPECGKQVIPR